MEDLRNPYLMSFCETLIKKKGLELSPEELAKKVDDMYRDFENMLGRKMIGALPPHKREEYLASNKNDVVDFEKIGAIFEEHISNPDEILKETMREFADLFSTGE